VNPKQLCVGHLSEILDDPQAELHKKIAKHGVFLGFDTVGHFLPHAPNADRRDAREDGPRRVVDAGYEDQVLLSSDPAASRISRATGAPAIRRSERSSSRSCGTRA